MSTAAARRPRTIRRYTGVAEWLAAEAVLPLDQQVRLTAHRLAVSAQRADDRLAERTPEQQAVASARVAAMLGRAATDVPHIAQASAPVSISEDVAA